MPFSLLAFSLHPLLVSGISESVLSIFVPLRLVLLLLTPLIPPFLIHLNSVFFLLLGVLITITMALFLPVFELQLEIVL